MSKRAEVATYNTLETAISGLDNSAAAGLRPNEVAGLQARLDQALAETYGVHGDRDTYNTLRARLWRIGKPAAEIPRERFNRSHPAQKYRGLLLRGAAYAMFSALTLVGTEYPWEQGIISTYEKTNIIYPLLGLTLCAVIAIEFLMRGQRKAKK